MSATVDVHVNTALRTIAYRDFLIDESVDGWEWTHGDYGRDTPAHHVTGTCQTMFECIDAVDDWYREAAFYEDESNIQWRVNVDPR